MKRRKGHEIDYAGKKYVSLHELCDDLDLPYSPLAHKYYRTKDIEQSVESVFCKTFLHKIAKTFCRSLQLHFVGNCKPGWQSWYLPAI